jgi:hypothetical protein
MNAVIAPLPQFDHFNPRKDDPIRCRCGHLAAGEVIDYFRRYHILGCARCGAQLAIVDHPTPAVDGVGAVPTWDRAA